MGGTARSSILLDLSRKHGGTENCKTHKQFSVAPFLGGPQAIRRIGHEAGMRTKGRPRGRPFRMERRTRRTDQQSSMSPLLSTPRLCQVPVEARQSGRP